MIYVIFSLLIVCVILLLLLLLRKNNNSFLTELEILKNDLSKIDTTLKQEISLNREEMNKSFRENREEQTNTQNNFTNNVNKSLADIVTELKNQSEKSIEKLDNKLKTLSETNLKQLEENRKTLRENREEQAKSLNDFSTALKLSLSDIEKQQKEQAEKLINKLDEKLKSLQEENTKKLEEMRQTVDEKLQSTVEKRFTESFKIISDRLEQVHKGLGEMQTLATGVVDLKKVLSNVKTRGVLGEIQLSSILEEILPAEFYTKNAKIKANSDERVEYAVKIPDRDKDNQSILLSIDSKFPIEDYNRLIEGYENSLSTDELKQLNTKFENAIKHNAKMIKEKYINPPVTMDLAIMFVPTEGLYSEITKRAELFSFLQNNLKIIAVGPANLAAFLNSLVYGFKTLSIEKRASEVWEILGSVKTQFGAFGDILSKTKKKLTEATNVIEDAERKSRTIQRKLKNVQEISSDIVMIESLDTDSDEETALTTND